MSSALVALAALAAFAIYIVEEENRKIEETNELIKEKNAEIEKLEKKQQELEKTNTVVESLGVGGIATVSAIAGLAGGAVGTYKIIKKNPELVRLINPNSLAEYKYLEDEDEYDQLPQTTRSTSTDELIEIN